MGAADRPGTVRHSPGASLARYAGVAARVLGRLVGAAFTWLEALLVRRFVRVSWGWSAVRMALALAFLVFVVGVLLGAWRLGPSASSAQLKLSLQPIYEAERAQMRQDAKVFSTGIRAGAVRPWLRIPARGMFGVAHANVRTALEGLIPTLGGLANHWAQDPSAPGSGSAVALISQLKQIDAQQKAEGGASDRGVIEYHLGLAELFAGDRQDAEQRFQNVLRLIDDRLRKLDASDPDASNATAHNPHVVDLGRLYSVQIATDYALGLAQLDDADHGKAASASLGAAIDTADARKALVAATADRLTTHLFPLQTATDFVGLDTTDVYTDLLAGLITRAGAGDRAADSELAARVDELSGKSMVGRPRLAANLQIAALLTGKASLLASFAAGASAADPGLPVVAREVQLVGGGTVQDPHDYWSVLRAWRQDLAQGQFAKVRRELRAAPPDLASRERAWLSEALTDAYSRLPAVDRARLAQQAGDLVHGKTIEVLAANQPLVLYAHWPVWVASAVSVSISLLLIALFVHGVYVALRTRRAWRVIYGSGYAADVTADPEEWAQAGESAKPEPRA